MTRAKQVMITVISTSLDHRKVYIVGLSRRNYDNKFLITDHTTDPQDAREFLNEGHALETIPKLVNHHGRTYTVENVLVNVSKAHPIDNDIK